MKDDYSALRAGAVVTTVGLGVFICTNLAYNSH